MFKRFSNITGCKRHIFNILISVLCMLAAAFFSSVYFNTENRYPANIALIFILFDIIVSLSTTGYLYGILCSVFGVLYFNYMFAAPYFAFNFIKDGYPITFSIMLVVSTIISMLTSRFALQNRLMAEHEKQLMEAESERMRANLLRAISHDLRTPLSGIIGNSSLYRDQYETFSEEERLKLVDNINEDASWLYNMVENLLTVTRIHNDDMTIKTNIEFVEEVVGESIMRVTKRHPECELSVSIPEDLIALPMDAILIEQVLINLIENALTHSGTASPVELIVTDFPTHVSFTVRDYGQGIPAGTMDTLFEGKAYSASHSADVQKGIGIGLVICKTIVSAHKGTISGKNHEKGAEFTFTLPKTKEETHDN